MELLCSSLVWLFRRLVFFSHLLDRIICSCLLQFLLEHLGSASCLFLELGEIIVSLAFEAVPDDVFFSCNLARVDILLCEVVHVPENHIGELLVDGHPGLSVIVHECVDLLLGHPLEVAIACAAFSDQACQLTPISRRLTRLGEYPLIGTVLIPDRVEISVHLRCRLLILRSLATPLLQLREVVWLLLIWRVWRVVGANGHILSGHYFLFIFGSRRRQVRWLFRLAGRLLARRVYSFSGGS